MYVWPHPIRPCRPSPFPCVWRRPRLAVGGAGIADSQERRGKPYELCKVIITCHSIFGMGQRIFSDALRARFLLSGVPRWGMLARENEEAFPNRYEAAVQPTVTLDLRSVSRRV